MAFAYTAEERRDLDARAAGPTISSESAAAMRCAPQPGAPFAYVTTARFLETFGLETLADLPDLEALSDAGLAQEAE
jgi:hypothetical protein